MTDPFRLLDAPQVVLIEIFKQIQPWELVSLSFSSKLAYKLVKTFMPKSIEWCFCMLQVDDKRVCLEWKRDEYALLGVRNISEKQLAEINNPSENLKIDNQNVPFSIESDFKYLVTYWHDEALGMKTAADYCTRLFNNIRIDDIQFDRSFLWMIDWVQSRQETVAQVWWSRREQATEEEYTHVLRDCKATVYLCIESIVPPDFQYSGSFPNVENLMFRPGSWLKIDNLLAFDSKSLYTESSKLTSSDVNTFIKRWLNGGCSMLEYLDVGMEKIENQEIFDGLDDRFVLVEEQRKFTWIKNKTIRIARSHDIRRSDGVLATIDITDRKRFKMFVWPN